MVAKDLDRNALIVDQGDSDHLYSETLHASEASWIGEAPAGLEGGLELTAKVRYRQPDQTCRVTGVGEGLLEVRFAERQRAVAPGQYAVFYDGDRCLGGAVIDNVATLGGLVAATPDAAIS